VTISQHQQQQLHQQQQQPHPGFSKLQVVKDYGNAAGGGGGAPGSGGGNGTGAPENNDMLKILEPIIVMKTK